MESSSGGKVSESVQRWTVMINLPRLKHPGDTNTRTAELSRTEKGRRVGMDGALEAIGAVRSVAS